MILLKPLIDLVFPPLCHCCKAYIPNAGRVLLCNDCMDTASIIESPFCTVCGIPFITEKGFDHPCGRCTVTPPSFDSASAPFIYEGVVRDLIHRLKYDGRIRCRRPLALMTAERLAGFVKNSDSDLIIPVPLHVRRIRQRGFNQAILIGEILSKEWQLPMERRLLKRIRWTEPQINLAASERAANVKGAFALDNPAKIKGRRVILIDDVLTTGSTVSECSKVLKRAGAAAVIVATVARVP